MYSLEGSYEITRDKSGKKLIYIVRDVNTLVFLNNFSSIKDNTIRLVLKNIDEELINMLIALNLRFEIVYELNEHSYKPFELLKKFMDETKNKVYINYNIENKTLFDRTLLIYYINHYNVTMLLDSKDRSEYNIWLNAITQYAEKKKVKKYEKKYFG